ncbi:hypothetical protein E2C01_032831 [Portunus trituberculatus]|uniref:Uncharacterized protein n=1 Tax=Portunus trituberculatus TaxID=210409 RepID=A0A5B7EW98_PORTR|nr:hypothetical protein [Portunus trituberculatus]
MGGVRSRSRCPGPSHHRPRYLDLLTKYIERLLHLNGLCFLQHYDPYVRQSEQKNNQVLQCFLGLYGKQ